MAPSRVKRIVAKSQIARTPITEQHQRLARDALSVRCDHENNSRIASCAHAHALFSFCSEACERKHTTKRNARGCTIGMSDITTSTEPAKPYRRPPPDLIDGRTGKPKAVPRKVRHAVRLMLTGECSNIKAAAERSGLTREHLSRSLGMPHIEAFISRESRKTIATGTMRASARLLELVDASSEHVSLDASKHVLAIEGIRPPDQGQVSVNVGVSVGYVIDLTGSRQSSPDAPLTHATIEHVETRANTDG